MISKITTGSAMEVTGKLVCTQMQNSHLKFKLKIFVFLGLCDHDYPLQKETSQL